MDVRENAGASVARRPPTDTRARLVEVAERLFAEYGIEAVSLRMVGAEAGQRNNSAIQYHFGSKDGLIEAIIAARSGSIDASRQALLDEMDRSGGPVTMVELVRLLVVPLAEMISPGGPRTWYLRFLANAMDHPVLTGPWRAGLPGPPTMRRLNRELRTLLRDLPRETFERRARWAAVIALRLLADHERQVAERESAAAPTGQVVDELTAALVALLRAP